MKKFKRRGGVVSSHLSEYEVELLTNLVDQLIELVAEEAGERRPRTPGDAAIETTRSTRSPATWTENADPPEDPVLRRLFPNAYPDDPEASADFRRFTQRELSDEEGDRGAGRPGRAGRDRGRARTSCGSPPTTPTPGCGR